MDGEGNRKTTRENAGVPPARFGDFVTVDRGRANRRQNVSQEDLDVTLRAEASTVVVSQRSRTSVASRVREMDIDIQTEEEMAKLDEEFENRQRDFTVKELEITRVQKEIEEVNSKLENVNLTPVEKEDLEKQRSDHQLKLQNLQTGVEIRKIEVEFWRNSLHRKKALLIKKAERNKLAIQEEDAADNTSQVLSDSKLGAVGGAEHVSNVPGPPSSAIEQWALTASLLNTGLIRPDDELAKEQERYEQERIRLVSTLRDQVKIPQGAGGGDQSINVDDEDRELQRRLRNLRVQTVYKPPPSVQASGRQSEQRNSTSSKEKSNVEQLAQVLAQAFQKAIPQSSVNNNSSDTRTLLARQVQGKELPIFSGRPEEWPAFITALENSTKSCNFSNADNLIRLQKCLKDEAKRTVQCLLISPDSVPKVIEKLKMRFGRPQQIIEALINKVREVSPVKAERLDTLIDFGIAVENLTSTIISLNQKEHLTNPMLINELVRKLPSQSQIEWIRHSTYTKKPNPSLKDFAEWLCSFTEAACILCPYDSKNKDKRSDEKRNPRSNSRIFTAKEVKQTSESNKTPVKKCACCGKEGHRIQVCTKFADLNEEDRQKFVREKRLCYSCLNYGHSFKDCRSKRDCGVEGCKQQHNKLLHKKSNSTPSEEAEAVKTDQEEVSNETVNCTVNSSQGSTKGEEINVGILEVRLRSPHGIINAFAELDLCATVTTLDQHTSRLLKLQGVRKPLIVKGFQSSTSHPESEEVQLEILPVDSEEPYLIKAKTIKNLDLARQSVKKQVLRRWKHLKNVDIRTYEDAKPKLLIGLDNIEMLIPREVKCGPWNAPFAMKTLLGWVIMGKVGDLQGSQVTHHTHEENDDFLHKLVKDQFTTEAFGIMPTSVKPRSREDTRAQEIMHSTLKRVDNGWEIGLLWRDENPQLPESKSNALRRLYQMEKRMDAYPDFAKQYVDRINDYSNKGFARLLTQEEANQQTHKTNYLPHFMAFNPKKPKKLRFVFDAAAKNNGKCLNDFLLQGPDKMTSLPGVLFKFRQRKIGITADIQDMFHRVHVRPEDAQAQRFLWRGLDRDRDPDTYEMSVLIFGASCSPACATEAKNVNALEFKEQYPDAYVAIVDRHYVDDYLDSVDTVDQGSKMFRDVHEVHARGGFKICNWLSNSREFLAEVPEDLRANSAKNLDMNCELDMERVLGLFWKPEEDVFTFNLIYLKAKESVLKGLKTPTKREMLSLTMSVYDPLGFVSLLTVKARIILQQTWKSKITWNDEIPTNCQQQWKLWVRELAKIPNFKMSRCYSPEFSTAENIQLHVFCDASEEAFGAAAYFRIKKGDILETALVMSKAKVAPIKTLSIPRLELQAALLGSRMAKFIHDEHEIKINETFFWSDSRTVICWLRSDSRRFHQFVSHRIGEIQELTNVNQWRWIPTDLNVADELTRFGTTCDWSPTSRWINGPSFLQQPESEWPIEPTKLAEGKEDESKLEVRLNSIFRVQVHRLVIDINQFSSWTRLVRVTAYVQRFIQNSRKLSKTKGSELTVSEIKDAEKWWLKSVQQEMFPDEVNDLSSGKSISKSSKLIKLNPYSDDEGVLRAMGRIEKADVPVSVKRPAILDSKHPYSKLLVHYYHWKCGHYGQERIVNELRQQFYLFHIRAAVKAAQFNCQLCKIYRVKPVVPMMGQLPSFRVEGSVRAFMKTGVDYFGPFEVVVKRSREKRYGVLFTCLATRAIHLEIAHSLSTDSCILAIRRFVGRRGCPAELHSDNGTNFHGSCNELKTAFKEVDKDQIQSMCTSQGIAWHFIPPSAPHMGGSWERMVRSVKVALGSVLTQKTLHDEVVLTLFIEAEHTVNSHPLTHVPDDPDDLEALTPNHFLIGRSSNLQPIGKFQKEDLFGRKQWRVVQQMAESFWRRWVREYLPTLLRRDKWNRVTRPIQVGDIVVEVNEHLPRNNWPKGIVLKTYPGRDSVVRVVDIKLGNGHVYKRPVSKLCILDVMTKDRVPVKD